jgi:hypothetical protein
MLSPLFIGGFLSSCGSFIEYNRGKYTYFAFQIKTVTENTSLLNQIAAYFEINNRVYNFNKQKQSYALLIIRNRQTIEKVLIPFFDQYIEGYKKQQYLDWKSRFIKNSSTWNYRNITTTAKPESYQIVDKKPNNNLLQSG